MTDSKMERVPGGDTQHFTPPIGEEETVSPSPTAELPVSIRPPSKREIVDAIKTAKNGKAAGSDNIPAEVRKQIHMQQQIFCSHCFKIYGRKRSFLRNGRKES
jgi:hypothetical protein